MRTRVEFTKDSLTPGLKRLGPVLDKNLGQVMRYHEPVLEREARHDAPWRDQTGNARNGLTCVALQPNPWRYELVLFHKVKYGIWLEVRWSGKFAVIMPTIRWYAPKVRASFSKLLDRMNLKGGVL